MWGGVMWGGVMWGGVMWGYLYCSIMACYGAVMRGATLYGLIRRQGFQDWIDGQKQFVVNQTIDGLLVGQFLAFREDDGNSFAAFVHHGGASRVIVFLGYDATR